MAHRIPQNRKPLAYYREVLKHVFFLTTYKTEITQFLILFEHLSLTEQKL